MKEFIADIFWYPLQVFLWAFKVLLEVNMFLVVMLVISLVNIGIFGFIPAIQGTLAIVFIIGMILIILGNMVNHEKSD